MKHADEQLIQMSSLPPDRSQREMKFRFSDRSLRRTFLFFVTLIGLTSFSTALLVGSTFVQFKQQCPLYASFRFEIVSRHSPSNWTARIVPFSDRFGSQSTCDFSTFSNVFIFIYCIVTGFFFVLFNSDQRVISTNDQCLLVPWFPLSLLLGLFSLIDASILTNGFLKFCSTMTSNSPLVLSCPQLNQIFFEDYPQVSFFFLSMLTAIVSAWFQLVFFVGLLAVLVIRLGVTQEKP